MHVVIQSTEPISPASVTVYVFDSHREAVEFAEADREHRGSYFVPHAQVNPQTDETHNVA